MLSTNAQFGLGLVCLTAVACLYKASIRKKGAKIQGIRGYKEDERDLRKAFKAALKENCKNNNFSTKSAVSSALIKYEKTRLAQAAMVAKQKSDAIIRKMKERGLCK
jgi:hypothetical protein